MEDHTKVLPVWGLLRLAPVTVDHAVMGGNVLEIFKILTAHELTVHKLTINYVVQLHKHT